MMKQLILQLTNMLQLITILISRFMLSPNNQRTVFNVLSNKYKGPQIIYTNARCLTADKLDYLKYLLRRIRIDIVCITEAWFKPDFDDINFQLLNFSCTRLDRRNGLRGGGFAFYYRKGITTSVKLKSNTDSSTEFLGIEIQAMYHQTCMIIGVYNSHRINSWASFFD